MLNQNKNRKVVSSRGEGRPDVRRVPIAVGAPPRSIVLLHGVFSKEFFYQLKKKKIKEIFVMEGRPNLEAAQINCRELFKRNIIPTLISDNMAGFLFFKNLVKEVWIAYQFSDLDGAVCDIGALISAVLGKQHKVPVYLFPSGRKTGFMGKEKDLRMFKNKMIASKETRAYAPLVEWVPGKYITKIMPI